MKPAAKSLFPVNKGISQRIALTEKLRPRERVLACLEDYFRQPQVKNGTRLPTIREMASRLQVSVCTVQQAFHQLAAKGRIQGRLGEGTFMVIPDPALPKAMAIGLLKPPPVNLGVKRWFAQVYSGIFQAAFHAAFPCEVVPLPLSEDKGEFVPATWPALSAKTDGLILYSAIRYAPYFSESALAKYPKPVVWINLPTLTATADFVAFDYFNTSAALGKAWKNTGRKRVVLLMANQKDFVPSSSLRCLGMEHGLEAAQGADDGWRRVNAAGMLAQDGYAAIKALLADEKTIPDAVYAEGDLLALGAVQALREHGLAIPREVSIVGGSGLDLSHTDCPGLTRTRGSFAEMGENLVALLKERLDKNGLSLPGRILPMSFLGGATTRPEENALLNWATADELPLSNPDEV